VLEWVGEHVRRLIALGAVVVIGLIVFVGLPGSARIATFHPETCLGGWENPTFAEGAPDVLTGSRNIAFSSANSAMNRNISADIFCGNFKGAIPEGGVMRTAVLSVSLYVGDVIEQQDGSFIASDAPIAIMPVAVDANSFSTNVARSG
jgi:hypothetical protein